MDDRMIIMPGPIRPAPGATGGASGVGRSQPAVPFDQLLEAQLNGQGVRFSRHAASRMESRGIAFDAGELNRLQSAVDRAQAKGARDSLVMLDDTALVVSVTNQTVVTVVDREGLKDNIFTNIDSAVIA